MANQLMKCIKAGFFVSAAGLGALAATNSMIAWNTATPGRALGGGFRRVPMRYGDMAYSAAGSGAPLLLLHALRPGNSSAEWENNFAALAEHFTVYAPDFLGWGLSDKPRHVLLARDYIEQILHFVEDVIAADTSTPVTVIASGEAAALALLAIEQSPERFGKVVLVCPATNEASALADEAEGGESDVDDAPPGVLSKLLTLPIIGQAAINFLTSRAQLENNARRDLIFDEQNVARARIAHLHASAHQSGAATALAAFYSNLLGVSWQKPWSTLASPALLVWGRNAPDYVTAPEWLALQPRADLEVFDDALLLPHVEHAEEFNARILKWLEN